jgi:hypothetical protein
MMHGREKSDPTIVAMKPAKSAAQAEGESVERRVGAKGKAEQGGTHRTLRRSRVYFQPAPSTARVHLPSLPEVGARCLNWARRVLCGGRTATCVPTATGPEDDEKK